MVTDTSGVEARHAATGVRGFFAARSDPYADADRENARRFAGLVWLIQGVAAGIFLGLSHPTARLDQGGWALAAAIVVSALLLGALLLRSGERVGDDALLGLSYLGVAEVAVFGWLAGSHPTPYTALYLVWVVLVPASHPPRRVIPFLGFVIVAASSPLVYGGWDGTTAADLAGRVVIWFALAIVVMVRVEGFRRQRIGLSRRGDAAEQRALRDSLTGLPNRRAFDDDLRERVAHARRYGGKLTLALADLDGFKEVNDRWGHLNGDRCLRRVAESLRDTLRGADTGYRWGGDEFAALLPETDAAAAERVCDRINSRITAGQAAAGGDPIAVSYGVVELAGGMDERDLLAAADLALMASKADRGGTVAS